MMISMINEKWGIFYFKNLVTCFSSSSSSSALALQVILGHILIAVNGMSHYCLNFKLKLFIMPRVNLF